jgi:hypothetical protein
MEHNFNKFVYWTPRISAIIFISFLAMFSLDIIFMGNYGFWETILGLFIHNIPVLILLVVLLISWKYEIIGGIAFIFVGVFFIVFFAINMSMNPLYQATLYFFSNSVIIAGPAFLVGILFLNCWFEKKKISQAA